MALWLARDLSVGHARKAARAFADWCEASHTAEACVGESRAAYWLGLMMDDAGLPSSEIRPIYEGGSKAGQAAQKKDPKNAGAYYWDAVNRAKSAEIRGIVASAGQLGTLQDLLAKVEALDAGYFYGGVDRYRGAVITRTPEFLVRMKGGSLSDGERYFQKAIKVAPNFVGTRRFLAELKIKMGDEAAAKKILEECLTMPDGGDPDLRAWNLHEKKLVKALLAKLSP